MATTALCNTFKSELLSAAHCFQQPVSVTGTVGSASTAVTAVSSTAAIVAGMGVTGTSIAAGTLVASVDSTTTMTLSKNTTAAISAGTLNLTGDVFKIALIAPSAVGTYDATFTNYSSIGADEVSSTGTGYTTGGLTLGNVSPAMSGGVGYVTFAPDPSWTGANFSTIAAVVYNSSRRFGSVTGRAVGVFDLGGTSTVSGGGTLTLVMPVASSSQALIRLQ
jgi:hypothetical protein